MSDARPLAACPRFAPHGWRATIALGAAVLVASALPGSAQNPVLTPRDRSTLSSPAPLILSIPSAKRNQKLTIAKGKALIVDLPGDASEVFVANPSIANAVVRTARRLYVMALDKGPTTITALNRDGSVLATLELNVTPRDIGELEAILKAAIPGNDIHVQQIYDTVILTGTVASALEAQRAQDIANGFTSYTAESGGGGASNSGSGTSVSFGSTPTIVGGSGPINSLVIRGQDQVTLKVSIVEVRREVIKQLGISANGSWGTGLGGFSGSTTNANTPTLGSVTSQSNSQTLNYAAGATSLSATIQAFERNGVARVIAEPNVTAISGETAKFQAGGTIPVAQSSSIDPTTGRCTVTTTDKNYGVNLSFTPTVLSEGRIALHVATEVSEPDGLDSVQFACSNAIGFRVRRNETTVELPSGGSIVSAGLIQQNNKQAIAGMPGLMNLPILGALFRSRDYQRQETELMVIVTPYLAKSLRPDQVSKPDDGFMDASDPQSWLLGRMNKIYSTGDNPDLARTYKGRVGFIND